MKHVFLLLVSVMLLGVGCVAPTKTVDLPTVPAEEGRLPSSAEPTPSANAPAPTETTVPAAAKKPYYVAFTTAQYEKAKAEGRPVLLYFYASWCPICRNEEPSVRADVEASDVPIAGFRVHFNDPETSPDEDALAEMFKVPYQHTSIIFDAEGNETERFIGPVDSATRAAAFRRAAE